MIHQQEILENILFRLPSKSIGRFRCVSKPWRALLSQPNFIKTHLNRIKQLSSPDQQQPLIAANYKGCSRSLYSIELKKVDDETTAAFATNLISGYDQPFESKTFVRVQGSCDGLTLVQDYKKLVLINLTTKERKELPEPAPDAPDNNGHSRGSDNVVYGFGYDSVSDDYKVVALSYYNVFIHIEPEKCTQMCVDIYSVKNGTWKRPDNSPYDYCVAQSSPGVVVDGYIHWFACRVSDYSYVIVAFDLGDETFREVPLPDSCTSDDMDVYNLTTLGGCLCMFDMWFGYKTEFWVMKEYGVGKSWEKFRIVDAENYYSDREPLCLFGTEQVLVQKRQSLLKKLVMYNLKDGRVKGVVVRGIPNVVDVRGTFMESLVSPHSNVEAAREEE